jgi:hypothetical protein
MGSRAGRRYDAPEPAIERDAKRDLDFLRAARQPAETFHHLRGGGGDGCQRLSQGLFRDSDPIAQSDSAAAIRVRRRDRDGRPVVQREFNGVVHGTPSSARPSA